MVCGTQGRATTPTFMESGFWIFRPEAGGYALRVFEHTLSQRDSLDPSRGYLRNKCGKAAESLTIFTQNWPTLSRQ